MELIHVIFLISLLNVSFIILVLYFKSFFFNIFNNYNAIQKIHDGYVPPLGGVIIFSNFFLGLFLIDSNFYNNTKILLGSILIIGIGIIEDFSGKVSPTIRFLIILIASIIYTYGDTNLPYIEIPILNWLLTNLPFFGIVFFSLGLTTVSNGINMIDGVNGLAGLTSLSILIAIFSVLILNDKLDFYLNEIVFLSLGICIFLIFNFPFGKIFLGDAGAYWIGWILGILVIEVYANVSTNTWGAALILFYPVFEVLFSFVRKIIKKKSPFHPDIEHLHIKLYFFLKGNVKRSIKFNSFVSVCLMPFWCIPCILIVWADFYSHLTILFLFLMILIYLYYYFTIPSMKK
jgi:UDP-N-acetylmuramyl pentapeptide phosphotransferase/UDP-N-acetylglucosamine-1-phosphate transferase